MASLKEEQIRQEVPERLEVTQQVDDYINELGNTTIKKTIIIKQ